MAKHLPWNICSSYHTCKHAGHHSSSFSGFLAGTILLDLQKSSTWKWNARSLELTNFPSASVTKSVEYTLYHWSCKRNRLWSLQSLNKSMLKFIPLPNCQIQRYIYSNTSINFKLIAWRQRLQFTYVDQVHSFAKRIINKFDHNNHKRIRNSTKKIL